jgi:hypothetical protein
MRALEATILAGTPPYPDGEGRLVRDFAPSMIPGRNFAAEPGLEARSELRSPRVLWTEGNMRSGHTRGTCVPKPVCYTLAG